MGEQIPKKPIEELSGSDTCGKGSLSTPRLKSNLYICVSYASLGRSSSVESEGESRYMKGPLSGLGVNYLNELRGEEWNGLKR